MYLIFIVENEDNKEDDEQIQERDMYTDIGKLTFPHFCNKQSNLQHFSYLV